MDFLRKRTVNRSNEVVYSLLIVSLNTPSFDRLTDRFLGRAYCFMQNNCEITLKFLRNVRKIS